MKTIHATRGRRRILGLMLAAFFLGSIGHAEPAPEATPRTGGGIRTDFGDVLIENLGIGRTYNLRELAGVPMKVTNSGAGTVNLVMDVMIPPENMISGKRQEMGFKPIPSVSWVKLSRSQFVVPSGESAYTDIIITIPDDPSLYGKKFQASIYSRSVGEGFLHLGVWSHLQLTIIDSPEKQAEMEKNRQRGFIGSMDYTLLPDKLVIENVAPGQSLDIRKELKKTIMIANSGEDAIDLRVRPVPIGDTPVSLQTGFAEGNLAWIHVKSDVIKVEGSSFADPGLTLTLPNDPSLSGKSLMFVVKVEPANPEIVGVTYYGKVYVVMKK